VRVGLENRYEPADQIGKIDVTVVVDVSGIQARSLAAATEEMEGRVLGVRNRKDDRDDDREDQSR